MPRVARLDMPGLLQHVIVRGIEKRDIFLDDRDRELFLERFSKLLQETETACFAWAVMPNHVHLLLRPNLSKLANIMRRLLTGYAITFNYRHQRVGHLFQNRYKSIVCEEDPYLLELIRYIHLNPLRAGLVKDMQELDIYPWSGHAVIMGTREVPGQQTIDVFALFGKRMKQAQQNYRDFVADGISQGRRDELVGGGKRRSVKMKGKLSEAEVFDERVLGSADFINCLRQEEELSKRLQSAMTIEVLIRRAASFFGVNPEALQLRKRTKDLSDVRSVICYFAVREMGHNGAEVAKALKISRAGVSVAAVRGEKIIQKRKDIRNIVLE